MTLSEFTVNAADSASSEEADSWEMEVLAPVPGSAACRYAAWPVAGREPRARSDAALAAGEEARRGHWRAGEEALRWRGEDGRSSRAAEQEALSSELAAALEELCGRAATRYHGRSSG